MFTLLPTDDTATTFRSVAPDHHSHATWLKVRGLLWISNATCELFYQCDAAGRIIRGGLTAKQVDGRRCILV